MTQKTERKTRRENSVERRKCSARKMQISLPISTARFAMCYGRNPSPERQKHQNAHKSQRYLCLITSLRSKVSLNLLC